MGAGFHFAGSEEYLSKLACLVEELKPDLSGVAGRFCMVDDLLDLNPGVFGMADHLDDLAHDVYVKMARHTPGINYVKRGYVFVSFSNAFIDLKRYRKLKAYVQLKDAPLEMSYEDNPLDRMVNKEQSAILDESIRLLGSKFREVVVLRRNGESYEDIANYLGLRVKTVGTRLFRAREFLRARMSA